MADVRTYLKTSGKTGTPTLRRVDSTRVRVDWRDRNGNLITSQVMPDAEARELAADFDAFMGSGSVVEPPAPLPEPTPAPGTIPAEPAGWRRIFTDDFNTDVPLGQFPSAVADRWGAYLPSWQGSAKNSYYDAGGVASVHDGVLDLWCHTQDGRRVTAAPYPRLPADPAVSTQNYSGPFTGYYTTSMRVAVRAKADAMPGYKTAWLTWPRSDDISRFSGGSGTWPGAGEIDFPEGDFKAGAHVMGFMHRQGGISGSDQDYWDAGAQWTDGQWHTFVMEWRMGVSCQLFCDGRAGPKWTARVPNTPMRYVIQTETEFNGLVPGPEVQGHVLIDWITVAVVA